MTESIQNLIKDELENLDRQKEKVNFRFLRAMEDASEGNDIGAWQEIESMRNGLLLVVQVLVDKARDEVIKVVEAKKSRQKVK